MTMRVSGDHHEVEDRPNDITGLVALVGLVVALGILASWAWAFIVLAIIFMIFMHEMGHFLTAKSTGMKVTEFFLGFGPRIWSFHRGETEYGVKLIPAGAYVRIIGMNNLDPVEPGDEDRAYRVKSFPRKLLVISAGSMMHFLMAFVLILALLMWKGLPSDSGEWVIEAVSDQSAAAALGLEPGDEIVSIDGIEPADFADFGELVAARGGREVDVVYLHDGVRVEASTVLGARLSPEGADAITGLEYRDRILAVDGTEVFSWDDVKAAVDGRIGQPLPVVFDPAQGDGPQIVDNAVFHSLPPADEATIGFFGVRPVLARDPLGPVSAVPESARQFGSYFAAVTSGMWDTLTSGAIPNFVTDTLSGQIDSPQDRLASTDANERELAARALDAGQPAEERIISIYGAARAGTQLTDEGFDSALLFMAGLNISVGLLNLLPLPPLDGGHVVVAAYERIRSIGGRRYEVDYNKVLPVTYVVFAVLSLVGLLAVFRDIIDPINVG